MSKQVQLSLSVLERFVPKAQLDSIISDYQKNKKSQGSRTRFDILPAVITAEEKQLARDYFDSSLTTDAIMIRAGKKSKWALKDYIYQIFARMVYQNKEKFL